ncbi:MAG: hypothetical protein WCS65_09535 [Verrucomicrobiae bacterium]
MNTTKAKAKTAAPAAVETPNETPAIHAAEILEAVAYRLYEHADTCSERADERPGDLDPQWVLRWTILSDELTALAEIAEGRK